MKNHYCLLLVLLVWEAVAQDSVQSSILQIYSHQKDYIPLDSQVISAEIPSSKCAFQPRRFDLKLRDTIKIVDESHPNTESAPLLTRIRNVQDFNIEDAFILEDYILLLSEQKKISILNIDPTDRISLSNSYLIQEECQCTDCGFRFNNQVMFVCKSGTLLYCGKHGYKSMQLSQKHPHSGIQLPEGRFAVIGTDYVSIYHQNLEKFQKLFEITAQTLSLKLGNLQPIIFSKCLTIQSELACTDIMNGLFHFLITDKEYSIKHLQHQKGCFDFHVLSNNQIRLQCMNKDQLYSVDQKGHFVQRLQFLSHQLALKQFPSALVQYTASGLNIGSKQKAFGNHRLEFSQNLVKIEVVERNKNTNSGTNPFEFESTLILIYGHKVETYSVARLNSAIACTSDKPLKESININLTRSDNTRSIMQLDFIVKDHVGPLRIAESVLFAILTINGGLLMVLLTKRHYSKISEKLQKKYNRLRKVHSLAVSMSSTNPI